MNKSEKRKFEEKKAIVSNLIKNTDVLEMQFESYGLKVSSFGYAIDDTFWLQVFVEIISICLGKLECDYSIKVNAYDENGNLIGNKDRMLCASDFNGFEAFTFYFQTDGIGLEAHKTRIFITKR